MAEENFEPAKTPKAKHLYCNDPQENQGEGVLCFCRNRKIEADLITEPKTPNERRDVRNDESGSRKHRTGFRGRSGDMHYAAAERMFSAQGGSGHCRV